MTERVLFVDDEPNVLAGIQRLLRKKLDVETAVGATEGLQKIRDEGPFAVVVSDMRMPQMNGAEFLQEVRRIHPDSVRMILSGQAELESTIEAVNHGNIFRFLTKPCSADSLYSAVAAGLEQYRLVFAERQLLEETLSGAVKVLTEILDITNPAAFQRASRVQRYAMEIGDALGIADEWQFRLAAMLSQIGCITLPADLLARVYAGQDLSNDEMALYESHPQVAGRLLAGIPRLEDVGETISRQTQRYNPAVLPDDVGEWDKRTLGAVVLQAATELDQLIVSGVSAEAAVNKLMQRSDILPARVREALNRVTVEKHYTETKQIKVSEVEIGMVFDEDIMSSNGTRLISCGKEVTHAIHIRLLSIAENVGIIEPFRVKVFR